GIAAAVAELVAADRHMLGARRRWYRYTGPLGWNRRPRGGRHGHLWTPADPADESELVVEAACPAGAAPVPDGFVVRHRSAPEPVRGAGLSGELVTLDGDGGWIRLQCLLHGPAHVHALHLDCERARVFVNRALFLDVIRSAHRVPAVRAPAGAVVAAAHWVD